MWKVSLYYLYNYPAFSHGNLAGETLSKTLSTIQDSANAVSVNTLLSRDKCLECLPSLTVHVLFIKLLEKIGTALLIGPAEIVPCFLQCDF